MKCSKCGSTYTGMRKFIIREKAKGSPSRGKNVKYADVKVTEIKCRECQTTECKYE